MRLLIYSRLVKIASGLQTFEKSLIKVLHKEFEIVYIYDQGNFDQLEDIRQYAQVIQNKGQVIRGDVCIYSSIEKGNHNIQAGFYIQMYHTEFSKWGLEPDRSVDVHIAVSQAVADDLLQKFEIESEVISNIIPDYEPDKVLQLVTASRIERGKGFDRMFEVAKRLKLLNKKFTWLVYGDGKKEIINSFKDIHEVVFMGKRIDIRSYIIGMDYLVQLSDNEGFCYSIHEALQVGTPVITTDWVGASDIIENGKNGYVVKSDLSNLNIDEIYNYIPNIQPKLYKYENADKASKWRKLILKLKEYADRNTKIIQRPIIE